MSLLDEIRAAYRVHHLRPIQGLFYIRRNSDDYACPLTALAIDRGILNGVKPGFEFIGGAIDAGSIIVVDWAMNTFGQMWVTGFFDGFDGQIGQETNPEYLQGFDLGFEASKQLLPGSL